MTAAVHLVVPGALDQRTGGYVYDRHMVEGLRAAGREVVVHELAGAFPFGDEAARAAAAEALRRMAPSGLPVIDGLALPAFEKTLARLPRRWVALVHHPLALETGLSPAEEAQLRALIDFQQLLEMRLEQGDTEDLTIFDGESNQEYSGEGEYERTDRFTDRITAEVIDVKPNGTLVLEARRTIQVDEEGKTLVLSGVCMSDAITEEGVVQSSQLADLRVVVEHEGSLRNAASKGWITKALDFLFPF